MQKTIWLSYDLGVKGDYPSLYTWLDNHKANECGDSIAVIKYEVAEGEDLPNKLKLELVEAIDFGKTDRVYLIWRSNEGLLAGRFIIGKRKAAPWKGYGEAITVDDI